MSLKWAMGRVKVTASREDNSAAASLSAVPTWVGTWQTPPTPSGPHPLSCTFPNPLGSPPPSRSRDGGSLCTSVAASLAGLHYLDGIHKVLGQADTTDLKEGNAHKDPSNNSRAVLQPLLKLAFVWTGL